MKQNTIRTFINRNVERQLVRIYSRKLKEQDLEALISTELLKVLKSHYMLNKLVV